MAFPTGWGRQCALAIASSLVAGAMTSFPLLLTEANLPSEMFDADGSYPALSGGGDIRFSTDAAGSNRLACEVVALTIDNDPANGTAEIWVLVPSVSASSDTTIYVWWNKTGESQPAVTDTYGRNAVWGDYEAVYHLYDLADSSGNNGSGLTAAGTPSQRTSGAIVTDNGDYDLAASSEYLYSSNALSNYDGQAFTMQVWHERQASAPLSAVMLGLADSSTPFENTYLAATRAGSTEYLSTATRDFGSTAQSSWASAAGDRWLQAYTCDGADGTQYAREWGDGSRSTETGTGVYHNGASPDRFSIGAVLDSSPSIGTKNSYFDEARLTSPGVQRSLDWLDAEFANVVSPGSFVVAGTPATPGGGGPTNVNLTVAGAAFTGLAVGTNAKSQVALSIAGAPFTGLALSVQEGQQVQLAIAAAAWTGRALSVNEQSFVNLVLAEAAFAGLDVAVNGKTFVGLTPGDAVWTGIDVTAQGSEQVTLTVTGTAAWSGRPVTATVIGARTMLQPLLQGILQPLLRRLTNDPGE